MFELVKERRNVSTNGQTTIKNIYIAAGAISAQAK